MGKGFSQKALDNGLYLLRGPGCTAIRVEPNGGLVRLRLLCSPCEDKLDAPSSRLSYCDDCDEVTGAIGQENLDARLEDWMTDASGNPLAASILVSDLKLRLRHLAASQSMLLKVQAKKAGRKKRKTHKAQSRKGGSFTAEALRAQNTSWDSRRAAWLAERVAK